LVVDPYFTGTGAAQGFEYPPGGRLADQKEPPMLRSRLRPQKEGSAERANASAADAVSLTSNGFNAGMHLRPKTAALATIMHALAHSHDNNRLKSEGKSQIRKAKDYHQLLLCAGLIAAVPKS